MSATPRRPFRRGIIAVLPLCVGAAIACAGDLPESGPLGPTGDDPTAGLEPIPPEDPFDAPPVETETGRLKVKTITSGSPIDGPGWFVSIAAGPTAPIGINETVVISGVPTGDRVVALQGLSDNCALSFGNNPRSMTVAPNLTAQTEFHVACDNPGLNALTR